MSRAAFTLETRWMNLDPNRVIKRISEPCQDRRG
jgi:hypothetical protein